MKPLPKNATHSNTLFKKKSSNKLAITDFFIFLYSKYPYAMLQKQFALWAIALAISTANVDAQTLRYSVAMPYVGLDAYSRHVNVFSFTGNQAALAQQKEVAVGVYGERRFMLAANSAYRAALAFPTRLGNFGIQLNYAGFKNFNENAIGLAYARSLGKKVDVGIQFNYYGYRVPGYGQAAAVNFELGAILHFSDKLHGGMHVYNPMGATLSKSSGEKLASAYQLGLGYDASDQFFISAVIGKEEDKDMGVTIGAKYQLMQQFFARAGFVTNTATVFAGLGLGWKNIRLDLTGSYHPQLGLSPGLLLILHFKKRENE